MKKRREFLKTFEWGADNPNEYGMGGYLYVKPGDTFKDGRYVAQKKLGWGFFATVWLGWDTLHSQYVALKFQISTSYWTSQAEAEIDTLEKVASKDQQNQRCVVKLLDHFIHCARYCCHVCMVFEYLGDNLVKLIKCYGPKGLPLRLVKHICLHILDGLDYFHTEFSLIHGDIKPENICLLSTIDQSLDPLKSGASPILPPIQKSNDGEGTSKIAEACTISLGQLVLSHDVESWKRRDDLMGNPDVNSVESHQKKRDDFMGNPDVNSVESQKKHDDFMGNSDVNSVESQKSHDDFMGKPDANSVEFQKSHDDLMGNPDVNSVESWKSRDDLMGNRKELLESLDHRCKLIDFGHACLLGKGDSQFIQTMPYRSPEVTLGYGPSFSTSADLWSFACVCFELAIGEYLFPANYGDDYCRDEDHLALMKQHLGGSLLR